MLLPASSDTKLGQLHAPAEPTHPEMLHQGYGDGSRAVSPQLHLSHTLQGGGKCCPSPGSGSDPGMEPLCPLLGTSGMGKLSHSPAGAEDPCPVSAPAQRLPAGWEGRVSPTSLFFPTGLGLDWTLHLRALFPKLSKNLHLNVQPWLQQVITHGGASEPGVGRCL